MAIEEAGIYVSFFIYSIGVLFIGLYFYRKTKGNLSSYFLADRSINPWVTALSAQASDMSGWLFMSVPAVAYLFGYQACWIAIGLALGTFLNWKIVAKRLRNFSEVFGNSITVPEYIQNRFQTNSPVIRLVCSAIIFIFFLLYVASGFSAEAKLFEELFGLEYHQGLFIGAGVILFYTFIGGFLAVSWTDFYQGILMFFALMIVPVILWGKLSADDITGLLSTDFVSTTMFSSQTDNKWGEIVSGLSWGLGYFGMPHILVRFMAIRSGDEIRKSSIIANIWVFLSLSAAIAIGLLGHKYMGSINTVYETQSQAEKLFMRVSMTLFNPWVAGILLSAILAAIMSTVSSQLLVVGSAMINDIYRLFNAKSSEKVNIFLGRASIIVVTIIAIAIAWFPDSSVMGFVSYAWSGFASTFAPVIIFSLVWKRVTLNASIAGLVVGALTVILWESFNIYNYIGLTATLPGFVLASVALIIISLSGKNPDKDIIDKFEEANNM